MRSIAITIAGAATTAIATTVGRATTMIESKHEGNRGHNDVASDTIFSDAATSDVAAAGPRKKRCLRQGSVDANDGTTPLCMES